MEDLPAAISAVVKIMSLVLVECASNFPPFRCPSTSRYYPQISGEDNLVELPRFALHHESSEKLGWDIFMTILIIFTSFVNPLQIGESTHQSCSSTTKARCTRSAEIVGPYSNVHHMFLHAHGRPFFFWISPVTARGHQISPRWLCSVIATNP